MPKSTRGLKMFKGKLEGPGRRIGCHAAREHAHETGIGRKEEAPSAGHFSKGCAFDKMIVRLEAILMFFEHHISIKDPEVTQGHAYGI